MKKTVMFSIAVALAATWGTALAGDAAAGEAKSAMCAACHGADGNSPVPTYPNLAGQHAEYLLVALKAYKSGDRGDDTMKGMVAGLSDEDMANLAAYYASQAAK